MKLAKILAAAAFGMVCQSAVAMDGATGDFNPNAVLSGASVVQIYRAERDLLPTSTYVEWPPRHGRAKRKFVQWLRSSWW